MCLISIQKWSIKNDIHVFLNGFVINHEHIDFINMCMIWLFQFQYI